MNNNNFPVLLKKKMDECVHLIYKVAKNFPRDELYNVTSQLKRASLSVILNYIEGLARQKKAVKRNFWEISYGSLKETQYLLHFSLEENYLSQDDYRQIINLADEIGAMLWRSIEALK